MLLKLVFTSCLVFPILENVSSFKVGRLLFGAKHHRSALNGTAFNPSEANREDSFSSGKLKTMEEEFDCSLGSSNSSSDCLEVGKKSIHASKEGDVILPREDPSSSLEVLRIHAGPRIETGSTKKTPKKRRTRNGSTKRYQLYPARKTALDTSDLKSLQGRAGFKNRNLSTGRQKAKVPRIESVGGMPVYFRAADEATSTVGSNSVDTSVITVVVYKTHETEEPISTTGKPFVLADTSEEHQNDSSSTAETQTSTAINQTEISTEQAKTGQDTTVQTETSQDTTVQTETGQTWPGPGSAQNHTATETDTVNTEVNTANTTEGIAPEVNYHYHFHYLGAAMPPTFSTNDATA